jgi:hypothetical protein
MVQHAYIIKIAKILPSPFASNTTLVTLLFSVAVAPAYSRL